MRNLKKVLTLVLTLAMLLSVMVVGAGAATFGDQESITNKEAVDVCTTLNIIGGYEDGTFRPAGNVTRAEMSKMICVALNGGQEPTMGSNLIATFNDVASTDWSAPYIEYCVSQGIVGGVGGGNFNPTGNITGTQAAKMLLCILGYNASIQGYVGSDYWETNINVDAAQKGLYAGMSNIDASAPLTRDQAAQMIWNALNAYEVEYTTTLVAGPDGTLTSKVTVRDKVVGENSDKITLLEDKYEAKTFVGTFNGNSDFITTLKDGQIQVTGDINSNGTSGSFVAKFPFDLDMKYVGEEVKVLYLDKTNDGTKYQPDEKDTIYGVYVTEKTTVYNIVKNDIQKVDTTNHKIKFNDTEYKYVTGTTTPSGGSPFNNGNIYTNYVKAADSALEMTDARMAALEKQSGDTIKLVANDSGDIVTAYVVESKLAKVNSVNDNSVSISNGVGAIDIDDNDVYSDVAKDDVVTVTTYYDDDATNDNAYSVVRKAETVSGTLTGYKYAANNTDITSVTVDGTTYDVNYEALVDKLTDDAKVTLGSNDIDSNVTLYMVNGFVGAIDASASSSNYAVVTGVDNTNDGTAGSLNEFRMKVMLADGTTKVVTVDEDSSALTANGGSISKPDKTNIDKGYVVKYASISDSGVMDLTDVYTTTNGTAAGYNKDNKTFNGDMTDYDAVLFVSVGTKYYAYNIRSLNSVAISSTDYVAVKNSDGKVVAAYVALASKPSGSTSDSVYGIVSQNNGIRKVNGDDQKYYVVSNDTGDYTVYAPTNATFDKGDIVWFDKTPDDVYGTGDVHKISGGVYIKEMDKDNVLSYYTSVTNTSDGYVGNNLKDIPLEDDAQIVYVDQDNDKGGKNNGVSEFNDIKGYTNAAIVLNDSGKIDAVIIETSNKCNILPPASTVTQDVDGAATNGETITITVTNTGIADSAPSVTLSNSAGQAVASGVATATASVSSGTLTITVTEDAAASLPAGTYTATVANGGGTYTFTIAA